MKGTARRRPVHCFENASPIEQAAGPITTMNNVGRMKRINGTAIMAGKRAAFSSARIMRSFRNSADNTRKADVGEVKPAAGQPK